jgi:hypothetical protein
MDVSMFRLKGHVGMLCNEWRELEVASTDFAPLAKSICEGPEQ